MAHSLHEFHQLADVLAPRLGVSSLKLTLLDDLTEVDFQQSLQLTFCLYSNIPLDNQTEAIIQLGHDWFGGDWNVVASSKPSEELFVTLSDWTLVEETCWTRYRLPGSPTCIEDRVAFIEKTPRVRVSSSQYSVEVSKSGMARGIDADAWISAPHLKGPQGEDVEERQAWCDELLKLLGWN